MNETITSVGNLGRLREISAVVVRHGFGEVLDRSKLFQSLGFRPRDPSGNGSRSVGRRLRTVLTELGPTYVKLGQVLSTRADLLPHDVISELSLLQDQVDPFPFDQVRTQVESGLGRTLEDAFSSFETVPIASASIAQAHMARTRAGVEVIVKVQRPAIRERVRADIELIRVIARFLESVVEITHVTSPVAIVDELEKAILSELDFTREAANVTAFRKANEGRSYVVVPHVVEGLSCSTVLTLEHLRGRKITDFDPAVHDRDAITRNLLEMAFMHLFVDGMFHGDPHPGNLLVLDRDRIGVIDLGLIGRLTPAMQETLVVMCLAIALKDSATLARLLYKIGVSQDRVNLAALSSDIQTIFEQYLGRDLSAIDSRSLLGDLLDLARKYRIRIPKEYAILAKSAITIEGVARKLSPDLDVIEVALPYAQRLLYDRMNPASKDASARRMLLQLQGFANDVPSQVSQILMDLEAGRLNITSTTAETQLSQLVAAVRLLAITVFASAVALGATYWLAQTNATSHSAVWCLGGAAAIFVGAFAWLVMGVRPRKLRLRR